MLISIIILAVYGIPHSADEEAPSTTQGTTELVPISTESEECEEETEELEDCTEDVLPTYSAAASITQDATPSPPPAAPTVPSLTLPPASSPVEVPVVGAAAAVVAPPAIPAPAPAPVPASVPVPGQAACIAALGGNQIPGGLTCHNTYNMGTPLSAGYGGCDLVKTSEGGIRDIELVWAFAKSKGYLVKGGGNCYDVQRYTFNGKSVTLIVMDNGSANDISIPAYEVLTGVHPGPNCEDAVCPIGNFQVENLGNVKADFQSFSKTYLAQKYPNTKIDLMYK